MARPPRTTIVLNLDAHINTVGLDTKFLSAPNGFVGFKNIPAGTHLLHCCDDIQNGTSSRTGQWFTCRDGDVIEATFDEKWDFTFSDEVPPNLGAIYSQMVDYPEDIKVWSKLSSSIDGTHLERICPQFESISTFTPLKEENTVLTSILKSRRPEQDFQDQLGRELNYTVVDERSALLLQTSVFESPSQLTIRMLDQLWLFTSIFTPRAMLAEFQFAYATFIVLGNMCSCTQWLLLLKLVLMSPMCIREHDEFIYRLLLVLTAQLELIPLEYMDETDAVVDVNAFCRIMENLAYELENRRGWASVVEVCLRRFGYDFRVTLAFDEERFEVYEIGDHDEWDEDAPAVVE